MKQIALVGPAATELMPDLEQGGYATRHLRSSELTPEDLSSHDLFLLSPLDDEGHPLYNRFRRLLGGRRASVILVLNERGVDLPESWIAGINDVIFWPAARRELLATVRRQLAVPRRREASTLARVRAAGVAQAPADLGCAVNVSLHGLLLEVQREYGVGDALEIEFFLEDDPEPITASGVIRRATVDPERFRRAYGVEFTRLDGEGRQRLAHYCEENP